MKEQVLKVLRRRRFALSVLVFGFVFTFALVAASEGPQGSTTQKEFWRVKPEVWSRIVEDRQVVVSALEIRENKPLEAGQSAQASGASKEISLKGAGLVSAPLDFVFVEAQKFQRLKEASSYFTQVRVEKNKLRIEIEAFDRRLNFDLDLKVNSQPDKTIEVVVVGGVFAGSSSVIRFESYKSQKTLISNESIVRIRSRKWPTFITTLALEVIAQRVGQVLRSDLEKSYQAPR